MIRERVSRTRASALRRVALCDVCAVRILGRWNSGRSEVKSNAADPLFEGFDCEDSVQSFIQIIQTAMKHKDELLRCGRATQRLCSARNMLCCI